MAILVTGGAGYIGSHTVVELQSAGYDVVVVDNLCNSSEKALDRVSKITGKPVKFYKADILDREALNEVFDKEEIDSCIHFAGLKAVGESVAKPWEYYENNIAGTLTLVDVMRKHNVKNIIFSSSATVYGDPAMIPITEECPKGQCTNPYGWTKSMLEQILTDIQKADPEWNVVLLRYFKPDRCSQERNHRRESKRNPEQPDAIYHTGSSRQAERAWRIRKRLRYTGWNRCP